MPSERTLIPTRRGQPLWFIATVLLAWLCGRVVIAGDMIGLMAAYPEERVRGAGVQPLASGRALLDRLTMIAAADATEPDALTPLAHQARHAYHGKIRYVGATEGARQLDHVPIIDHSAPPHNSGRHYAAIGASLPIPQAVEPSSVARDAFAAASPVSVPVVAPPSAKSPRAGHGWSGSAWMFWRDKGNGNRASYGSAGQLGGSQAGVRIERRLTSVGRVASLSAYGRVTAALSSPHMPEAAAGFALRPLSNKVPVMIGVERRIALDHDARNAFALFAAGGLNPTAVGPGLIAQGYAQAGMVGLSRRDLFIDGRMSLGKPLDRNAHIVAGVSLSGGAQPGLSRLDIGPMIDMRLPIKGSGARLIVEWRHRVAGQARPGSGLSATLASDF